ncbi:DUF5004 domain-containing protein [Flavobacterium silvaticum]|uniref:DUF5004 domain-containing protein n=1 Tax=Flavobacterium silvaticum TaxID=1852020 RepID=A0A972JGS4_9FLAO|nr:DUF5004 domain-containing protein [Flavobacterium silvaticum]NMH29339.1 DUF5004 domain-containing protein [Flavobacterium silvaticum]
MKNRKIYWMCCAILLAFGCNETDDGNHVDGITLYEKIAGSWSATNVKMTDEVAKAGGAPVFEQNLTTQFNYDQMQISFNVDEKMQPTTYEVSGNVPPLFEANGYYKLSSDYQPMATNPLKIYLYSDAALTAKTGELRVTAVPGSTGEMELQLVRTSGGVPFVSYAFKLTAN